MVEKRNHGSQRKLFDRDCYDAEIDFCLVSDLGLAIQALEAQNSERFKIYLASKRKQIHDYHVNSQTASRYYQNMANSHRPEQSYYFNEKQ